MQENEAVFTQSNIYIDNREQIRITGVKDVNSFDDFNVSVKTDRGDLVINGEELKISKLDVDSGELLIDGKFNSLFYNEENKKQGSGSVFGRMFR